MQKHRSQENLTIIKDFLSSLVIRKKIVNNQRLNNKSRLLCIDIVAYQLPPYIKS